MRRIWRFRREFALSRSDDRLASTRPLGWLLVLGFRIREGEVDHVAAGICFCLDRASGSGGSSGRKRRRDAPLFLELFLVLDRETGRSGLLDGYDGGCLTQALACCGEIRDVPCVRGRVEERRPADPGVLPEQQSREQVPGLVCGSSSKRVSLGNCVMIMLESGLATFPPGLD